MQAIQDFLEVREAALRAFEARRRAVTKMVARPQFWLALYVRVVLLGVFVLSIVTIVPQLAARLDRAAALSGIEPPPGSAFVVAFLLWACAYALPGSRVWMRSLLPLWAQVLYALVAVPLLVAAAEALAQNAWRDVARRAASNGVLIFIAAVLIVTVLTMLAGLMPRFVFLAATSSRAGPHGGVLPSYEVLMGEMLAAQQAATAQHSQERIEGVALVAQHKHTGLDVRTQTVGLLFSVLALVGLLQLTLAQTDTAQTLNDVYGWYLLLIGQSSSTQSPATGVVLIGVVLIVLVIGGLLYGTSAYLELRLLEAVTLFCALRLRQSAAAAPAAISAPAAGTPAAATPAAAPAPRASLQGGSWGLLGWTALTAAIAYRVATALTKRTRNQP